MRIGNHIFKKISAEEYRCKIGSDGNIKIGSEPNKRYRKRYLICKQCSMIIVRCQDIYWVSDFWMENSYQRRRPEDLDCNDCIIKEIIE